MVEVQSYVTKVTGSEEQGRIAHVRLEWTDPEIILRDAPHMGGIHGLKPPDGP